MCEFQGFLMASHLVRGVNIINKRVLKVTHVKHILCLFTSPPPAGNENHLYAVPATNLLLCLSAVVEPSILTRKCVRDSHVRDRRWKRLNAVAKSYLVTTSYAHSKRDRLGGSRTYRWIRNFSKRRRIRHVIIN